MDWKEFDRIYHQLHNWYSERQCKEPFKAFLRCVALSMRGNAAADTVLRSSLKERSLENTVSVGCDLSEKTHDSIAKENVAAVQKLMGMVSNSPELLGVIYERKVASKKKTGVFYTPANVVDFILERTLGLIDITSNPRVAVMDLACGGGAFLLRAYDLLYKKFTELTKAEQIEIWGTESTKHLIKTHILLHNLHGMDIDPVAVDITRAALLLKSQSFTGDVTSWNVVEGDGLRRETGGRQYDCVVGNPPYLSFGLRGNKKMDETRKKYLKEHYKETIEYKISYYALFLQKSTELLSDLGRFGLIIPDSFLSGRYFSKLRRYLLENTHIEILNHISAPIFKTAATGFLVICICRRNSATEKNRTMKIHRVENEKDFNDSYCYEYSQDYFSALPHNRFRLFFSRFEKNLIEKIEQQSKPLVEFLRGYTGIRSLQGQKTIVSERHDNSEWHQGLVSGREIDRYFLNYGGKWIHIHESVLYKGGWRAEVIARPKILIRQTSDTIRACIDSNGYYHLNNIHSFAKCTSDSIPLEYFLLLLNSRLLDFYYRTIRREQGRTMAQTPIETLELLPVKLSQEMIKRAIEIAQKMMALQKQLREGAPVKSAIRVLEEKINKDVYHLYELSEDEVDFIEKLV